MELREAFEDVAVYFTRKEWELLEEEDQELYRDQMLRNYQALLSLGYQGPTPGLICCIRQGEVELWVCNDEHHGKSSMSENLWPDSCDLKDPWDSSAEESSLGSLPASNCSLAAGSASMLRRAGEQSPEEGPADLEPPQTSSRSGGRDPLSPEKDRLHKRPSRSQNQTENILFHKIPNLAGCESGGEVKPSKSQSYREAFGRLRNTKRKIHQGERFNLNSATRVGLREKQELTPKFMEMAHPTSECRETFSYPSQHQHIHSGRKTVQCMKCKKSFTSRQGLSCHQRVHSREQPSHCTKCEKSFSQMSKLALHQLI